MAIFARVATSHSLTILSNDPEASIEPSGENATELTIAVCFSVAIFCLVTTSHSLTVLSSAPPEASVEPLGENATEVVYPSSRVAMCCDEISQRRKDTRLTFPSVSIASIEIGCAAGLERS